MSISIFSFIYHAITCLLLGIFTRHFRYSIYACFGCRFFLPFIYFRFLVLSEPPPRADKWQTLWRDMMIYWGCNITYFDEDEGNATSSPTAFRFLRFDADYFTGWIVIRYFLWFHVIDFFVSALAIASWYLMAIRRYIILIFSLDDAKLPYRRHV